MRTLFILLAFIGFAATTSAQSKETKLVITPLTGDFYIYETFHDYNGASVSANSMYLVTDDGVVLFDTPWDSTQFQPLMDSIEARHHKKVIICIATHFHEDRTAGLEYYSQQGIKTYTTIITDSLSKKNNKKRSAFLMQKDSVFSAGKYAFQTFYPGAGHAPDNIVIWFEKEKILYGGCFIKSAEATTLGNLSDANPKAWAYSVARVQQKCRNPRYVIPGHDDWKGNRSLSHTAELIKAFEAKQKRKSKK